MTIIEAVVSGLVQGLTEFLPVSSSGHLVLVHSLFGFSNPGVLFDVCLHLATLVAVIFYFSKDILIIFKERNVKMFLYIVVGTIPAIIAALLFDDYIVSFFTDAKKVSVTLILTGIVLLIGQNSLNRNQSKRKNQNFVSTIIVGVSQAFALLPGMSRSGLTISAGIVSGVKIEEAFKFSFLLSIPAVLGAVVYKGFTPDAAKVISENITCYSVGMIVAFVTGLLSLRILWWMISQKKLFIFAVYCILVGITGILL